MSTNAYDLFQYTDKEFNKVDILLKNASIIKSIAFIDHTDTDFDEYITTILRGKFFTAQAVIKQILKQGGRGVSIVHTGSMGALQAPIGATSSSAYLLLAGVYQLVKNIALEYARDNIRINTVAFAVIETPVYNTFMSKTEVKEVLPTFNSFRPLGRNGQTTDVVNAILFLLLRNVLHG